MKAFEPISAQACQHAALVWNPVGHDPIERTDAVGRDQQQSMTEIVDVADLALTLGERSGAQVGC